MKVPNVAVRAWLMCAPFLSGCGSVAPDAAPVDASSGEVDAPDTTSGEDVVDSSVTEDVVEVGSKEDTAVAEVLDTGEADEGTDVTVDAGTDVAADVAPDVPPIPCTAFGGECGPDGYCKSVGASCGSGTCAARPTMSTFYPNEACGCDGITYSAADKAFVRGVSVRHYGACTASERLTCNATTPCPHPDDICGYEVAAAGACGTATEGVCYWMGPCYKGGFYPAEFTSCGDTTCGNRCAAVKAKKPFYPCGP